MKTIHIELIGDINIYVGLGIEILTAVFLGGLVGYDREKKMKAAGVKTNIMICIGATLYTAVSMLNMLIGGDANRVAAQVVSGIGFLGAGAIIRGRGNIIGLTTAATIWVVAAIGVTIGSGYPLVAAIFTVTSLLVLKMLTPLNKFLESEKEYRDYHLEVLTRGSIRNVIRKIILGQTKNIYEIYEEVVNKTENERIINIYLHVHPRQIKHLVNEIRDIIQVEKVNYHAVDYEYKNR